MFNTPNPIPTTAIVSVSQEDDGPSVIGVVDSERIKKTARARCTFEACCGIGRAVSGVLGAAEGGTSGMHNAAGLFGDPFRQLVGDLRVRRGDPGVVAGTVGDA